MVKINIEKTDLPFVKYVTLRDGIKYSLKLADDTKSYDLSVDIPEDQKTVFLKDIECEKESAQLGGIPVYSYETITDRQKLKRLQKLNGTTTYIALAADANRIAKEMWQM